MPLLWRYVRSIPAVALGPRSRGVICESLSCSRFDCVGPGVLERLESRLTMVLHGGVPVASSKFKMVNTQIITLLTRVFWY